MAEVVSCDAGDLLTAARQFCCVPHGEQADLVTYLVARLTNSSTDPTDLAQNAQEFCCLNGATAEDVLIYLLVLLAEPDSDTPNFLLNESRCLDCIPTGMQDTVIAELLYELITAPTETREEVINHASCLKCFPPGMMVQAMDFMLYALAHMSEQLQEFVPPVDFVSQGIGSGEGMWNGPQSDWAFGYNPPSAKIHWTESTGAVFDGNLNFFYANATLANVVNIVIDGQGINNIWGLNLMPLLQGMILNNNQLSALDLSGCSALQIFTCDNNPVLTSMFAPKLPALRTLSARNCHLGTFPNFGFSPQKIYLDFHNSVYGLFTFATSATLQYFDVGMDSPLVGTFPAFNASLFPALYHLSLAGHPITLLDVSLNPALQYLDVGRCKLAALDVSMLTQITYLDCDTQAVVSFALTLGALSTLQTLKAFGNPLTGQINYDPCTALQYVDVNHCDNQTTFHSKLHPDLTYVDFSHTTVNDFNFDDPSSIKTLKMAETAVISVDTTKFAVLEWFDASRATAGGLTGVIDFASCPNLAVVYLGGNSGVTDILFLINPGSPPTPPSPMVFLQASTCGLALNNQVTQLVGSMANLVSADFSTSTNVSSTGLDGVNHALRFVNFAGCALSNSAYIDAILKACSTFAQPHSFGIVDLRFGTNAPPSVVGNGYKLNLLGLGWIVETN